MRIYLKRDIFKYIRSNISLTTVKKYFQIVLKTKTLKEKTKCLTLSFKLSIAL